MKDFMKGTVIRIFSWWYQKTLGTQLYTLRRGECVGKDASGNFYYRTRARFLGKDKPERRWVIYHAGVEATSVPPLWHSWLHRMSDTVPSSDPPLQGFINPTGSSKAYCPRSYHQNSHDPLARRPHEGNTPKVGYEAWVPQQSGSSSDF
jgi:NADH:ubiquinone oxidoreductase subunit